MRYAKIACFSARAGSKSGLILTDGNALGHFMNTIHLDVNNIIQFSAASIVYRLAEYKRATAINFIVGQINSPYPRDDAFYNDIDGCLLFTSTRP